MIIDELIAVLGYDIRGEAELKRFNAGLERTAVLAQRMAVALVAAGTLAAGAMIGLGKSVIETSAKFEGFQTSLETIEGSAEKAKSSMDWISKFAAKTPYELDGVTEAFIKLRAYGFDPMDGTLKTLGDTASAMNKPLNQAVEAFADAATFEFERLKEFGIKASQKGDDVTFRWQQNGKEMTKVVKKNGKEVSKFLLDTFGGRFNNAMDRQSKTWNGMMSNLGDSWEDFKRRIGNAGFFDAAKKRLAGLLDYIARLDKDGSLDRWAKNISKAMTGVADFAEGQIKGLIGDFQFLTGWIKANPDWLGPIKTGLIALGAVMFPKTFALLVLQDIIRWMQGKGSVIGDFAKSLSELIGIDAGAIGTVLGALAAAGAAFMLFGGTFSVVASGVRGLAGALALLAGSNAAGGLGVISKLVALAGRLSPYMAMFGLLSGGVASKNTPNGPQTQEQSDAHLAEQLKKARQGNLLGDYANRRKAMEDYLKPRAAGTIDDNTPGIMELFRNMQGNSAKMGGGAIQPVVNDNSNRSVTTNTNVQLTVQQMSEAANAAANAVRGKVSGALSSVASNSHPTRTTPSPTF